VTASLAAAGASGSDATSFPSHVSSCTCSSPWDVAGAGNEIFFTASPIWKLNGTCPTAAVMEPARARSTPFAIQHGFSMSTMKFARGPFNGASSSSEIAMLSLQSVSSWLKRRPSFRGAGTSKALVA